MYVLVDSEQVVLEHVVAHVQVQSQPIGYQDPRADSEIDRELILVGKLHIPDAHDDVERRVEGAAPSQKHLAGQYVVAHVEVVVREVPPRVAQHRDGGESLLQAALAGLGAGEKTLEKEVFGHVIGGAYPVERVGAEVLDAEGAEVGAELEVRGLDLVRLYLAPVDLGLYDGRLGPGVLHGNLLRMLVAAMEPAAARQQ